MNMIALNNITIAGSIVLAPIAGFTDSPFRRIARRHGAGLVFTELISAEGIVRNNRKTRNLMRFSPEERPIAVQIFGKDPHAMADAAQAVESLDPDIIDINMGCCAPRICASGAGAALLKNPDLVEEICSRMVQRVKIPVSAKIRIGWDDSSRNYMEIVKRLENAGISLISVHGRTRAQKYGSAADWDAIKEIREKSILPVIGNGDIHSHKEAHERLQFSGCHAVMIGRGAIGNPWIFSGWRPSTGEIIHQIKEHLSSMIEYYGEYGVILMRKHLVCYIRGIRNASQTRRLLLKTSSFDEVVSILDSIPALPASIDDDASRRDWSGAEELE